MKEGEETAELHTDRDVWKGEVSGEIQELDHEKRELGETVDDEHAEGEEGPDEN